MMIEFHPAALSELIDSAGYYDSKLPGLGADFLNELHGLLTLLSGNPAMGAVVEAPFRQVVLGRFPFSVIYRPKGSMLRIVAVAHQHRRPGYWRGRD
jgi:plasmid stabilization system protein ParE